MSKFSEKTYGFSRTKTERFALRAIVGASRTDMPPRKIKVTADSAEQQPEEQDVEATSDHLELWNSVQATDPKYTKKFSRGGGFSGTAINATFLAKKATDKFGPIGIGWGIVVEDETWATGAPLIDDKWGKVGEEVVHVLRIMLWYDWQGVRGEVRHYGQTVFVGKNKHGIFTDEEAPKKSLTDAMSKALSLLGFASDVHLGLYDDNKYVNDLKAAAVEADKPKGPTLEDVTARVNGAKDVDALKAAAADAAALSEADRATLKPIYVAKLAALKAPPVQA